MSPVGVATEMALNVLAYNMKRVMTIMGAQSGGPGMSALTPLLGAKQTQRRRATLLL
jgi:hypothetical protein